jgi:TonB family protein
MMRVLVVFLLASSIFASPTPSPTPVWSPSPPIVKIPPGAEIRQAKTVVKYAPRPKYSADARKHHWTGVGWFTVHVDEPTGVVTSVDVLQRTGHDSLDRACLDALKRWRFFPHSKIKKLKIPITFVMHPDEKV